MMVGEEGGMARQGGVKRREVHSAENTAWQGGGEQPWSDWLHGAAVSRLVALSFHYN